VWRIEAPKIIATVARMVRDIGLAEELAQDALVTALERWPRDGVPDNPGAWLTAAAKRRAIDALRHRELALRKHEELGRDLEAQQALVVIEDPASLDDDVGDDLLRLDRGRRLDASGVVRGGVAIGARARRARAGRARGARPRGPDGDPGFARPCAHRARWRADPAAGPEPRPLGSTAHPPRPGGAG